MSVRDGEAGSREMERGAETGGGGETPQALQMDRALVKSALEDILEEIPAFVEFARVGILTHQLRVRGVERAASSRYGMARGQAESSHG